MHCNRFRVLAAIVVATVVSGCGGGGGGSASTGAGPAAVTTSLKASIDQDPVSTPNAGIVSSVVTPFGSTTAGGTITVAKLSADAPTMLIGLDSAGNERLLRFEGGDGALSADSTAYALVRLGLTLADRPADAQPARTYSMIRKSTAYPAVIAAVRESLTQATPGGTTASQAVVDAVAVAVQDVLQIDAQLAAGAPSHAVLMAAATSLPYYLWDNGVADKAWISGGPLTLNNRTFLFWRMKVGAVGSAQETTVKPMETTRAQLAASYVSAESKTPIVPTGDRFTVTLDQSKATELSNAAAIVTQTTSALIEVLQGATDSETQWRLPCAVSVANDIVLHPDFVTVLANFSADALLTFVWENKIDFVRNAISACQQTRPVPEADRTIWERAAHLPAVKAIAKVYKALTAARTAARAYGATVQFSKYIRYTTSVDICMKDGNVSPCPDPLQPAPVTPTVPAPGLQLTCDASFESYLSTLPAFASPDLRSTVAGARLDVANFLANPGATTLAQINAQAAQYRSTQADLERLYLQVNSGQPVSQLCQASVSAPSTAGLIDSIAIAWGSVRIGIALDTWGSNRLQCMQAAGFQPAPIESYCPK
jgi:hypothetical protein